MVNLSALQNELQALGSPEKAAFLSHFFKTGKGQYGEGDQFLGIKMPEIRAVVAKYSSLSIYDWTQLLHSPFHEFRMAALIGLMNRFQKSKKDVALQKAQHHLVEPACLV